MIGAWVLAARPKTLPAALVPVWVGCVLAWKLTGRFDLTLAACTLFGAIFIQVATNLFNDAIDAGKGADTEARLGPKRVTASGMLPRGAVYAGAVVFLLLAFGCGVVLYQARGWEIVAIGLPSLFLAYGYTGGPFPLAYLGLGELFVILFFGVVAVTGTVFIQTEAWPWEALVVGVQVGLLSAVLITINNLRDVSEDAMTGKRTLAVRWGRGAMLKLLTVMIWGAMLPSTVGSIFGMTWWFLLSLPLLLMGLTIVWLVRRAEPGPAYNTYLALAGAQLLLFAVVFTLAVLIR
jgi:1,4-dihydroxy-2-naphthoate octaprenyltransferase